MTTNFDETSVFYIIKYDAGDDEGWSTDHSVSSMFYRDEAPRRGSKARKGRRVGSLTVP